MIKTVRIIKSDEANNIFILALCLLVGSTCHWCFLIIKTLTILLKIYKGYIVLNPAGILNGLIHRNIGDGRDRKNIYFMLTIMTPVCNYSNFLSNFFFILNNFDDFSSN